MGNNPSYFNGVQGETDYGTDLSRPVEQVGQKLPNPWGLHDMYGNVFEWCQDWYGDYAGGIVLDPQGPTAGSYRAVRGGGYRYWHGRDDPVLCRSAVRRGSYPDGRDTIIGFRVILAPGQP